MLLSKLLSTAGSADSDGQAVPGRCEGEGGYRTGCGHHLQ